DAEGDSSDAVNATTCASTDEPQGIARSAGITMDCAPFGASIDLASLPPDPCTVMVTRKPDSFDELSVQVTRRLPSSIRTSPGAASDDPGPKVGVTKGEG